MSSPADNSKKLTRRQALKSLAALAGAAGLVGLPNGWQKPFVKVGALPAFAAQSPALLIDAQSFSADLNIPGVVGLLNGTHYPLELDFDYSGAVGGVVSMDVTLDWSGFGGTGDSGSPALPTTHVVVDFGSSFPNASGHITTTIYSADEVTIGGDSADVYVFIKDGRGATSNTVTDTIYVPSG